MTDAVVDANILLRHLTGAPAPLADRAQNLLVAAEQRSIRLIVTALTLAEVVFVLQHTYRWPRRTLAEGLGKLLASDTFYFPEMALLEQALAWYRDIPRLHFADAYIAAVAAARHAAVVTFDQEFKRLGELAVVDSPEAFPSS